jgi:hypothetical protein
VLRDQEDDRHRDDDEDHDSGDDSLEHGDLAAWVDVGLRV